MVELVFACFDTLEFLDIMCELDGVFCCFSVEPGIHLNSDLQMKARRV